MADIGWMVKAYKTPRLVWSQLVSERSEVKPYIEWMREQVELEGHRIIARDPEPVIFPVAKGFRIEWNIEVEP